MQEHKAAPAAEPGDDKTNYYYYNSDGYSKGDNPEQVLNKKFPCMMKNLTGSPVSLLSAEIEIWATSFSKIGQPRTEAYDEPFA
jgi:hypothetical protein